MSDVLHMRTSLVIDDELLARARAGLEALIAREAGKRLAALAGTQPKLSQIARRRLA